MKRPLNYKSLSPELQSLFDLFYSEDQLNKEVSLQIFKQNYPEYLQSLLYYYLNGKMINCDDTQDFWDKVKQFDFGFSAVDAIIKYMDENTPLKMKSLERISITLHSKTINKIEPFLENICAKNIKTIHATILLNSKSATHYKGIQYYIADGKSIFDALTMLKTKFPNADLYLDPQAYPLMNVFCADNSIKIDYAIANIDEVISPQSYHTDGKSYYCYVPTFDIVKDHRNIIMQGLSYENLLQMKKCSNEEYNRHRNQYFKGEQFWWEHNGVKYETVEGKIDLKKPMAGFDKEGRALFWHSGSVVSIETIGYTYRHGGYRVGVYKYGKFWKYTNYKNLKNFRAAE